MQAGETGLVRSPAPGESSRPRPAPPEPRGLTAGWDRGRGAALGRPFFNLSFPHPPAPGCGGEARPGGAGERRGSRVRREMRERLAHRPGML